MFRDEMKQFVTDVKKNLQNDGYQVYR